MKKFSLASAFLFASATLSAASLTWDTSPGTVGAGDGTITAATGTWDTATANWTADGGATNVTFTNGDTVGIGGTASSYTVTVSGGLNVSGIDAPGAANQFFSLYASGASNTLALSGTVNVATAGSGFELAAGAANAVTGSFTKTGAGALILTASQNMNLTSVTLSAGVIGLYSGSPSASTAWVLNGGAIGSSDANAVTIGGPVTIGGNIIVGAGPFLSTGIVNFTGTVDLGGAARTITLGGAGGASFAGVISNGTFSQTVAGTLTLLAANNLTGTNVMNNNGATLRIGNDKALGSGTMQIGGGTIASDSATARTLANALNLNAAATVKFGDTTGTGTLTFTGGVALSSSGTARGLSTVADTAFSGVISGTNTSTITKTGSGTLTISGSSANSIKVTTGWLLNAGTVAANKTAAFGDVTGTNGAVTLGGGSLATGVANVRTGAFKITDAASQVTINGSSAGTITLASGQALTISAGQWNVGLANGVDTFASAGGGAAFTITGGTLNLGGGAIDYGRTYTLITGFTGSNAVTGLTITGYDTANRLAALGTDGVLSFSAVPEPSAYGLIGAGALAAVSLVRRRRGR